MFFKEFTKAYNGDTDCADIKLDLQIGTLGRSKLSKEDVGD